jgi:hypothetical protein
VAQESVDDIRDIAGGGTTAVAEVVRVHRAGVVGTQGLVDALGRVMVAKLLQVGLVVVGTGANHGGNLLLE